MDITRPTSVQVTELEQHAYDLAKEHAQLLRRLRELRIKHGLSQAEVGERMGGISQSAIAQLESYDANPTLITLRRYALAVGADITTHVTCRACPAPHGRDGESLSSDEHWAVPESQFPVVADRSGSTD